MAKRATAEATRRHLTFKKPLIRNQKTARVAAGFRPWCFTLLISYVAFVSWKYGDLASDSGYPFVKRNIFGTILVLNIQG